MKFNHLNVPTHWRNYWTRYPEGHTILEALIQWVSQVDSMVDNQNKLNDNVEQFRNEIDDFIGRFDERLQDEVTQTLKDWQNSGFLDVVISEALQWQLDDYIATNEQDKLSITAQLQQTVNMASFPKLAVELDDTGRLNRAFAKYGDLNRPYKIILDGTYNVSDTLEIGNYAILDGNNAVINMTDTTKEIVDTWGYEVEIKGVKFVGGKHGVVIRNPNIDHVLPVMRQCVFEDQSDYSIYTDGAISTKIKIENTTFVDNKNGVINADSDGVTFDNCWVVAKGSGLSYFKSNRALTLRDCFLIPSIDNIDKANTFWIENTGFYLNLDGVRFSGEFGGFPILKHTKQKGTVQDVVSFDGCYFWGTNSNIELHEIPDKLSIKRSTITGQPKINVIGKPKPPVGYVFDVDIELDTTAYFLDNYSNHITSLGYSNKINSNSYFNGFADNNNVGVGGSRTNTTASVPFGVLRNVKFGLKDTRLLSVYSKSYPSLSGLYTGGLVIKTNKTLQLTIRIGNNREYITISPSNSLAYVSATGVLNEGNNGVVYAIYDPQENTEITWGSPFLYEGNVKPFQTTPEPNTLETKEHVLGFPAANTPPADGYWLKGATLFNANPTSGSFMGWVCVTTGSPGTWKGFGQIEQ